MGVRADGGSHERLSRRKSRSKSRGFTETEARHLAQEKTEENAEMATQFTATNTHDSGADTRTVSYSIQAPASTAMQLDHAAHEMGYASTNDFLTDALGELAARLTSAANGEPPFWAQPGKARTYVVEFRPVYEGRIQADNDAEAEELLELVSLDDTADAEEWYTDPYRFQKRITASYVNADDEEQPEEGTRA